MIITGNVSGIGSAPTERLIADLVATAIARTVDSQTATRPTVNPDANSPQPPVIASIAIRSA